MSFFVVTLVKIMIVKIMNLVRIFIGSSLGIIGKKLMNVAIRIVMIIQASSFDVKIQMLGFDTLFLCFLSGGA